MSWMRCLWCVAGSMGVVANASGPRRPSGAGASAPVEPGWWPASLTTAPAPYAGRGCVIMHSVHAVFQIAQGWSLMPQGAAQPVTAHHQLASISPNVSDA